MALAVAAADCGCVAAVRAVLQAQAGGLHALNDVLTRTDAMLEKYGVCAQCAYAGTRAVGDVALAATVVAACATMVVLGCAVRAAIMGRLQEKTGLRKSHIAGVGAFCLTMFLFFGLGMEFLWCAAARTRPALRACERA